MKNLTSNPCIISCSREASYIVSACLCLDQHKYGLNPYALDNALLTIWLWQQVVNSFSPSSSLFTHFRIRRDFLLSHIYTYIIPENTN